MPSGLLVVASVPAARMGDTVQVLFSASQQHPAFEQAAESMIF